MKPVLILGHFTLDSIILAQKREVHFDVPQGNALATALGAVMLNQKVSLCTKISNDYSTDVVDILKSKEVDFSNVSYSVLPSLRYWILREGNSVQDYPYLINDWDELSPDVDAARKLISEGCFSGIHICPMPFSRQQSFIEMAKEHDYLYLLDPPPLNTNDYLNLKKICNRNCILSISYDDIVGAFSNYNVDAVFEDLCAIPAKILILRVGAKGCIIFDKQNNQRLDIGIYETNTYDPTGAGDCYNGAFMAQYLRAASCYDAAIAGSVAASYIVENIGMIHILNQADDFQDRYQTLWEGNKP